MRALNYYIYKALSPRRDNSCGRSWRYFGRYFPHIWLSPPELRGLRLSLRPTDWSQTLIFDEVFHKRVYDLYKVPFTPRAVVDCGAHIGMFSLLAAATFPSARLTAFEPHPENILMIKRQIAGNNLSLHLIEAAVSDVAGTRRLLEWNSHSGHLAHDGLLVQNGIQVKVTSLPDFILTLNTDFLLLKLDVEGEEARIFPRLAPILPKRCAIFFETHSGLAGWQHAHSLLAKYHFEITMITSRGAFFDGFAVR